MARFNIVEGYGVTLRRLTSDKIELLRHWRNHPKIQKYMEYREEITPEQQIAWFNRIDNENNYYFIIEIEGKEIGCINIRDIDYEKGEGEPGIFIWDDDYLKGKISYHAGLCMGDFLYDKLGLRRCVIHILSNNQRSIHYHKSLGYKLSENQEGIFNQEYSRTREDYHLVRDELKSRLGF